MRGHRDAVLTIALAVIVLLVIGVIAMRDGTNNAASPPGATKTTTNSRSRSGSPSSTVTGSNAGVDDGSGTATTASTHTVMVHVAGAVLRPGVVKLNPAARVINAIDAVGGSLAGAERV